MPGIQSLAAPPTQARCSIHEGRSRKAGSRNRKSEDSHSGHPESGSPAASVRCLGRQASITGQPSLRARIAMPRGRSIQAISTAFQELDVAGASPRGAACDASRTRLAADQGLSSPPFRSRDRGLEAGHRSFVLAACKPTSLNFQASDVARCTYDHRLRSRRHRPLPRYRAA